MAKKKILVIGYGGTIVMVVDKERNAVVPAENKEQILELLPRLQEYADVSFDFLTNKDSTNVTPSDWTKLGFYLQEHYDEYDGFVITHGTNTLAYTATALSFVLGRGFQKPVILTGSQLPLTVYGNDARFNFENAIQTAVKAVEEQVAEIMIVFDDVVLRGCRSVKVSESSFNAFTSPAFPKIGSILSTGIHFADHVFRTDTASTGIDLHPHFDTNIISIDLTPGQRSSMLDAFVTSGNCRGVILKSHGAGSVPTDGEYSLLPFIEKTVHTYKIPVIVATKFLGGNAYKEVNDAPAIEAIDAGAIPGGDLTDVATEVKLMWLLANGYTHESEIREQMTRSHVGEITEF